MHFSTIELVLTEVFGGDIPQEPLRFYQVAARAIVVYLLGILIVRVGKSRLISHLTAMDALLGFILGSLLSRGITGHASISATVVSSASIVFAHSWLSKFAILNPTFEAWFKGHAYCIIKNGICNHENMSHTHLSESDLDEQLRLHGVESRSQVKEATKERSGELSVLKNRHPQVVEISDQEGIQTIQIQRLD